MVRKPAAGRCSDEHAEKRRRGDEADCTEGDAPLRANGGRGEGERVDRSKLEEKTKRQEREDVEVEGKYRQPVEPSGGGNAGLDDVHFRVTRWWLSAFSNFVPTKV